MKANGKKSVLEKLSRNLAECFGRAARGSRREVRVALNRLTEAYRYLLEKAMKSEAATAVYPDFPATLGYSDPLETLLAIWDWGAGRRFPDIRDMIPAEIALTPEVPAVIGVVVATPPRGSFRKWHTFLMSERRVTYGALSVHDSEKSGRTAGGTE